MKAIITLIFLAAAVQAETITVNISGFINNDGFCRVVLFSAAEGFPSDYAKGIRDTSIEHPGESITITLADLPAGTYAISVLHDRNGNKRMDSGLFGMPREPYGVSNNVHPRTHAPRFDECSFVLRSGDGKVVDIRMKNP